MHPQLIPVHDNALPEVAAMAHTIWHAHYVDIIGLQQVEYMLGRFYNLESLNAQVRKKNHRFYFIVLAGQKQGFVSVSYDEIEGELFIHKFYILPQQQKGGIGTAVMQALLALYSKARTVRLTVNRQNHKSINFYFKNGFIIEKVADFDIGQGYLMNDFVMVKQLKL